MRRPTLLSAIAGALLALVAAPALGVGNPASLELTPGTGAPRDLVQASGSDWDPDGGAVSLYADVADVGTERLLAQQEPTVDGNVVVSFALPDLEPGSYTFYACQRCSDPYGGPEARRPFEVTAPPEPPPVVVVDRESAQVGETVIVSGHGWSAALGAVTLTLNGATDDAVTSLAPAPVPDELGVFEASVRVPDVPAGGYVLRACQACTDLELERVATDQISVVAVPTEVAEVTVDPAVGRPAQPMVASGTGWSPDEPVLLFAQEALRTSPTQALATATVSDGGTFRAELSVPWVASGPHRLYACQGCAEVEPSRADSAEFIVSAPARAIVVTPESGRPGETVSLSGSGWSPAFGDVSVFADRSLTGDPGSRLLTTTPGPRGRIAPVPVQVPDAEPGTYRWYACQRCGEPDAPPGVTVAFTVGRAPTLSPVLRVDPDSGEVGETVRATGAGWSPDRGKVRIFGDQDEVTDPSSLLASADVAADGTFESALEVPDGTPDSLQLFACQDCGSPAGYPAALASFQVERTGSSLGGLLFAAAAAAALAATLVFRRSLGRRRPPQRAVPTGRPQLRPAVDEGFRAAPARLPLGEPPGFRLVPHDTPVAVLDPPPEEPP